MKLFALAAMVAACPIALALPALADDVPCQSASAWQKDVGEHSHGVTIVVLEDVAGAEAAAARMRYNATPPQSDLHFDRIVVLGALSIPARVPSPYVLVGMFAKGCLEASGWADPVQAYKLIHADEQGA